MVWITVTLAEVMGSNPAALLRKSTDKRNQLLSALIPRCVGSALLVKLTFVFSMSFTVEANDDYKWTCATSISTIFVSE